VRFLPAEVGGGRLLPRTSYTRPCSSSDTARVAARYLGSMKILLWVIAIIFFIGLAVVLGMGKLLF
jgi:hypothetical protein